MREDEFSFWTYEPLLRRLSWQNLIIFQFNASPLREKNASPCIWEVNCKNANPNFASIKTVRFSFYFITKHLHHNTHAKIYRPYRKNMASRNISLLIFRVKHETCSNKKEHLLLVCEENIYAPGGVTKSCRRCRVNVLYVTHMLIS